MTTSDPTKRASSEPAREPSRDPSRELSSVERYAEATLPTEHGEFQVLVYKSGTDEAVAMVSGDLDGNSPVLVRVHSECMTGEVLGSLRCDCRAQLDLALGRIAAEGGVLVYLRQEGRGIGLGNKIRAYALQDAGRDTVDANLELGFEADARTYEVAVDILADLGVHSVRLMTNNPRKQAPLARAGIAVSIEPHWAKSSEQSQGYLETKRARLGHINPHGHTTKQGQEPT